MYASILASKLPARSPAQVPDFWTVFGAGVTIGPPTFGPVAKHSHEAITGTDSVTGYSEADLVTLYGSGTQYELWGIGDGSDPVPITDFIHTITTPVDPIIPGARQLTNGCAVRVTGSPNPQTHLYVGITAANALAAPIESSYFEYDLILPEGLDLQLGDTGTGNFYIVQDFKDGAWYNGSTYKQAVGSFRIKVGLTGFGTGGVNRWQVTWDNDADGRTIIPELRDNPPYNSVFKYGEITNTTEPVRLGVRTKIKMWYKRPSGPNDLTTGRLKVEVNPEGFDPFILADIAEGYQLCGQVFLPLTRLLFLSNYTSAVLPNPLIGESLAIYNNPTPGFLAARFSPDVLFAVLH